ncbi:MAG: TetR family transcriptional regulator C-terminal domain-containing protein [Ilumatobacteraceae bacterium]
MSGSSPRDLPPEARELLVATAELMERQAPGAITEAMAIEASGTDAAVLSAHFGDVAHDPELRDLLATEQRRLTDTLVELVAGGQGRGWVSRDVDPYAMAVLVQAYTLGRVVDDVTGQQMDPAAWTAVVSRIVDHVIIASD